MFIFNTHTHIESTAEDSEGPYKKQVSVNNSGETKTPRKRGNVYRLFTLWLFYF